LNKSIIRVEQPDINFEEEEEETAGNEGRAEDDESEMMRDAPAPLSDDEDGNASEPERMDEESNVGETQSGRPKKKLKISFEEYKSVSNLLLMYMRREENRSESTGVESEGLKRSQIVEWYLNEIGDDIESEQDLLEKKVLVEKIIDRLVKVKFIYLFIYSVRKQRFSYDPSLSNICVCFCRSMSSFHYFILSLVEWKAMMMKIHFWLSILTM